MNEEYTRTHQEDMIHSMPPTLSRRRLFALAGQLALSAALAGCANPFQRGSRQPANAPGDAANVSLAHKIGQMLIVGFQGLGIDANAPVVRDLREHNLGGVILFEQDVPSGTWVRNIQSPDQVRALVAALHEFAPTPLLVAIDHEGGQVNRLKEHYGFPPTVSHQTIGNTNDLAYTRQQATSMAQTLQQLGINLNFAPVVDLHVNPANPVIARYGRSFSADPAQVAAHALAFIAAHHKHGIRCTLKHFPGHGSSLHDSHAGFVDVTATWSRRELEPYRLLIDSGMADAIMTAHVFHANIDPNDPATLSYATIQGMLRDELGYDGVVVSDDLQMAAITQTYSVDIALQKAIRAGVDLLILANNAAYHVDTVPNTVALIERLVHEGAIPIERIEQSYQRIQRLKGPVG